MAVHVVDKYGINTLKSAIIYCMGIVQSKLFGIVFITLGHLANLCNNFGEGIDKEFTIDLSDLDNPRYTITSSTNGVS